MLFGRVGVADWWYKFNAFARKTKASDIIIRYGSVEKRRRKRKIYRFYCILEMACVSVRIWCVCVCVIVRRVCTCKILSFLLME